MDARIEQLEKLAQLRDQGSDGAEFQSQNGAADLRSVGPSTTNRTGGPWLRWTVWKFSDALGADRAEATLQGLQKQELITVHDAAIVSWPEGKPRSPRRISSTA